MKTTILILVAAIAFLQGMAVTSKASVTIIYEVAEIKHGGSLANGTLLFVSNGANNSFESGSWTSGSNFVLGDDRLFAAVQISNGVASGLLASYNLPTGTVQNTTKFTGIFINGLSGSDIDYTTGALLGGKTFGTSGGTSYGYGTYRTDSIEAFGGDPTGNMAWVFPSDGNTLSLSAYSGTGDYVGQDITANLATSSSLILVPEPSTGALLMIGSVGLVALRRLRKV